eukprot:282809-Chlamydomonas_euryale.AAC.3
MAQAALDDAPICARACGLAPGRTLPGPSTPFPLSACSTWAVAILCFAIRSDLRGDGFQPGCCRLLVAQQLAAGQPNCCRGQAGPVARSPQPRA